MANGRSKLVTVGTYVLATEAYLAKTALANEGIDAFIANEYLLSAGEAFQPMELQVHANDAERVADVLERGASGARRQLDRGEPIVCPECQSDACEVVERPPDARLARLIYGLRHDSGRARCACHRCGYAWDARW